MDLKEIKSIIDLMKKNSLSEFELEEKDFKIKLKRPIGGSGPMLGGPVDDPELTAYSALARQSAASVPAAHAQSSIPAGPESEIKSPMIGTFYNTLPRTQRPTSRSAAKSAQIPWCASWKP